MNDSLLLALPVSKDQTSPCPPSPPRAGNQSIPGRDTQLQLIISQHEQPLTRHVLLTCIVPQLQLWNNNLTQATRRHL